jgi:hypothetical protein
MLTDVTWVGVGERMSVDHHGGHKICPVVFIWNIAKYKNMTYGERSAEIGNKKCLPKGFFHLIFFIKNATSASSSPW